MEFSKIKSIKKIGKLSKRYDISVENTNNFFANNILVHNSNIQLIFENGEGPTICSRNRVLEENEKFFGVKEIVSQERYEKIFNTIKSCFPNRTVNLYGELIGKGIQKGVDYGNEKQIRFFDMAVDGMLISPYQMHNFFKMSNIDENEYMVPLIAIVESLKDALDFDCSNLNSYIINKEDNIMEGIVIKPCSKVVVSKVGQTFMLKKKNEKFLEESKKPKRVRDQKAPYSEKVQMLHEQFGLYINENRVNSVFSKTGVIEDKRDMGKYIKEVLDDAKTDYLKKYEIDMEGLDKQEIKYIYNHSKDIVDILKKHL